LSAVPFHFWCPDVFEGAAAEIGAFLSVASKGAANDADGSVVARVGRPGPGNGRRGVRPRVGVVFAAVTATFGNLAAYSQTNLKRLLAYSTIAHAGYMIMGLAVVNAEGFAAVLFYLVTYLFTKSRRVRRDCLLAEPQPARKELIGLCRAGVQVARHWPCVYGSRGVERRRRDFSASEKYDGHPTPPTRGATASVGCQRHEARLVHQPGIGR